MLSPGSEEDFFRDNGPDWVGIRRGEAQTPPLPPPSSFIIDEDIDNSDSEEESLLGEEAPEKGPAKHPEEGEHNNVEEQAPPSATHPRQPLQKPPPSYVGGWGHLIMKNRLLLKGGVEYEIRDGTD